MSDPFEPPVSEGEGPVGLTDASLDHLRQIRVAMPVMSAVCGLVGVPCAFVALVCLLSVLVGGLGPASGFAMVFTGLAAVFELLLGWQGLRASLPLWQNLDGAEAGDAIERSLRHMARLWMIWALIWMVLLALFLGYVALLILEPRR